MKPHFRIFALTGLLAGGLALSSCTTTTDDAAAPNQLTAREKREGWKLLFDGQSLAGWRSFGKPAGPDHGWEVKDGMLNCVANAHGGDIITTEQFTDFDFQWDWRIPTGANNGIKYMVTEKRP